MKKAEKSGVGEAAFAAVPRRASAPVVPAAPAPRVVHVSAVVDVAAIAEAAAIMQPVACDDCVSVVHEPDGLPPTALVEVACRAGVMPRVRDVPAVSQTANVLRAVAVRDEVCDQGLKAPGKAPCDCNRPGGGRDRDHAA